MKTEIAVCTNEELAVIFSAHMFCKFKYAGSAGIVRELGGISYGWNAIDKNTGETFKLDKCKLMLTPLFQITDEHLLLIAKIHSGFKDVELKDCRTFSTVHTGNRKIVYYFPDN